MSEDGRVPHTLSERERTVIEAWTSATRFALYYAPARDTTWWDTGCRWLGRDPETGERLATPEIDVRGQDRFDVATLSVSPRRYGWHGTLVAPARCAQDVSPSDVLEQAREWARRQQAFSVEADVATLGDFVAVRPAHEHGEAALRAIASSAVRACAALRAMPSEHEIRRRLESDLTPRQRDLLAAWGYPYVFDEFRFHMTLTDSLANEEDRQTVMRWWRDRLPGLGPLSIDSAALYVEPEPGAPFLLWARLPFEADV
ncbi:MAG TPA: DUF1045 domain-containing protein [Pararobbsia sp.]|nr:DUF1045 domain-containing protein [Pararobbsia sp.]